jgi:hypothetical protein
VDHLTPNFMLSIGGLALAIFGGWILPAKFLADGLALEPRTTMLLRIALRYAATPVILAVGLAALVYGRSS